MKVAEIEDATLRRSQRFAARVWRSSPFEHQHNRKRLTETVYAASAVHGVVLFVVTFVA